MTTNGHATDTVPALLQRRVAESPSATAYAEEDAAGHWNPVDWAEYAARVGRLARGMSAAGLHRGDRLAIIAPVSLQWELLHHAALSIGVVVAGMDAHDLPERVAAMVEVGDIQAFAVQDVGLLARLAPGRLARARFVLDLGETPAAEPLECERLTWSGLEAAGAAGAWPPGPVGSDIATIIFTSGTTGTPKAIPYSHAQVCLAVDAICEAFAFIGPHSRLLCWLPLSNLFQRIVNLAALRSGAATHLLGDPRRVMAVVAGVSPDVFVGVPRFFEKLVAGLRDHVAAAPPQRRVLMRWAWSVGRQVSRVRRSGRRLPPRLALSHAVADRLVLRRMRRLMGSRLRCMVTGSAPTPVALLEDLHAIGWIVLEAYGLSENVVPMAMNRIDDFRFGTVGRPMDGNDVDVGPEGAVRVRGPGLFSGYLGDGAAPLDADGYYRTGDLGAWDADGFLRLVGRENDLIKTSTGRRIAPTAVEAHLAAVPGVDQTIVIGNGRKCLIAICTLAQPRPDAESRRQLVATLDRHLAAVIEHERPAGVILLDRPFNIEHGELTPNLKLRRMAIEQRHADAIDALYRLVEERPAASGLVTLP